MIHKTIYLIDELQYAKTSAPDKNHIGVHNVSIHRDNRSSIFQHPPSQIKFLPFQLGENPKLKFACGIKQKAWLKLKHPIIFKIFLSTTYTKPVCIFHKELTPGKSPEDQIWQEEEIDLSRFSQKKIKLTFSTSVPIKSGTEYCWSVWGNPCIEHECPPVKKSLIRSKPAHVILITADALRPDFLGAYGNQIIQTPNSDHLAKEGVLFNHARAQTVSTLGSHASILSGQSPVTHAITTEWGRFPRTLLSLPKFLNGQGYQSLLVPSELELIDPKAGLGTLFEKTTPCIGNPAQDGTITTRTAIKLLEGQKRKSFLWIQYFDTHPPVTPPEPFRSMYYSGDPVDSSNIYRPDAIKKIRGTETGQELLIALPLLEKGQPEEFVIAKLEATAQAFREQDFSDPDLAIHLKNLGPKSYRNTSREEFASWLEKQVYQLKQGTIPKELLAWLYEILPFILVIDDDITTWLDQVVDFRYPLAQYSSAISYFDSHIGSLFAYLKENDLFDQSTIILTSPHGEILDEHGIYFHHHTLTESCIRIPVIIKPAKHGSQITTNTSIDGVFDSLDLFPTIADLLNLPSPEGLEGKSRYPNLITGSSIPLHDSFTLNNSHTMASITRGNYKLIKVMHDHLNSAEWSWHKGDRVLFDLRDTLLDTVNIINSHVDLAEEMEHSLDRWLEPSYARI